MVGGGDESSGGDYHPFRREINFSNNKVEKKS
jgi:hypothetical protein